MGALKMSVAALALLLAIETTCRAGDAGCGACGTVSSCCDDGCADASRGILNRWRCRDGCPDPCCAPACGADQCCAPACAATCSGPRGVLNRRHQRDCCEDACGKSHIQKFMEWLCYRPGRCHACKSHAPCCTPPLYTFFTCCEGEGCGACRSYSACSSCSSCGK